MSSRLSAFCGLLFNLFAGSCTFQFFDGILLFDLLGYRFFMLVKLSGFEVFLDLWSLDDFSEAYNSSTVFEGNLSFTLIN